MAKKSSKSSTMVLVTVVIVVFIAAIGIAMSTLGGNDQPAIVPSIEDDSSDLPEASEPNMEDPESTPPENSEVPSSTPGTSTSTPATSTPASSTPASSTPASSTPATVTLPTTFDPASVGSSGADKIAGAKAKNSDVMGWLRVPGTNIDHPVLYHKTDVNYYMAKDLNKNYSKNGVVWADPETDFGAASEISRNTVLYGHNWTNISANPRILNPNDVMFGQLAGYHHLNFAKVTPYIHYSTEAEEMTWRVFAAFYTDIGFNYIEANPSDSDFLKVVAGAKARSRHVFDVDVKATDKIITLSTCTRAYGPSDKQRFVVMARLVRYDEEYTPVTVTANPNPVLPNL